jgi:hypothetical protein
LGLQIAHGSEQAPKLTFSEDVAARIAANPIMDYLSRNPTPLTPDTYVFANRFLLAESGAVSDAMSPSEEATFLATAASRKSGPDIDAITERLLSQAPHLSREEVRTLVMNQLGGEAFNSDLNQPRKRN